LSPKIAEDLADGRSPFHNFNLIYESRREEMVTPGRSPSGDTSFEPDDQIVGTPGCLRLFRAAANLHAETAR
jgi:hypothetical protein